MVKDPKRHKGVLCPNCAVPLWVWQTRQRADGSTVRVRVCKTCGHRVKTYERPAQN